MSDLVAINCDNSTITGSSPVLVLAEVLQLQQEAVSLRRWFHANAELSYQEFDTAKKIVEALRSFGIQEIYEGIGKTGVVAVIRGQSTTETATETAAEHNCIALRADMDALPITEVSEVSYRSRNAGAMHACGHDGHVAGLLIAAKVLQNSRTNLRGSVKLVFQPAEEGYAGAAAMIEDGLLDGTACGPSVDSIYGIHLWSMFNLGEIGCQNGPAMAAADKFCIEIKGRGGHGAAPHETVDAIVESAHLITALQTVVARNIDPLETGVLSCGTIGGGYSFNIIPDRVEVTGTCRTFTKDTQQLMKDRIHSVCCGMAATFGGEINFNYEYKYPPTVNAYPECTALVRDVAEELVGTDRLARPQKTMIAEDFSFFLEKKPGCFFFVGAALPGPIRPHHQSVFDFDERAIMISASVFVGIARRQLC